ncbi:MAG: DUF898 domain-containing protein [Bacteroidetes bacterium]|nr:MAG: DUF898 domain-containing protein [Bacteroidota bacterium]
MEEFPKNKFSFSGSGKSFFGIQMTNILLTIVTLGFYYPWARAATLRYVYQETEFFGSRFAFHGTGKEIFRGFIKAIGVVIALYLVLTLSQLSGNLVLIIVGTLVYIAGLVAIIPLVIHGAMKYRMSRTTWRGIHFGYRGELKELYKIFLIGAFYTVITLGIYSIWLGINIRKYVLSNTRMGNVKFSFIGEGSDLFFVHLAGRFLSFVTLGIYLFSYMRDLYKFNVNNVLLHQEDMTCQLELNITAMDVFKNVMGNFLIVVFTLGLGLPWATMRNMSFYLDNMSVVGYFEPDKLEQTEDNFNNATSDDLSDMLDLGLV